MRNNTTNAYPSPRPKTHKHRTCNSIKLHNTTTKPRDRQPTKPHQRIFRAKDLGITITVLKTTTVYKPPAKQNRWKSASSNSQPNILWHPSIIQHANLFPRCDVPGRRNKGLASPHGGAHCRRSSPRSSRRG